MWQLIYFTRHLNYTYPVDNFFSDVKIKYNTCNHRKIESSWILHAQLNNLIVLICIQMLVALCASSVISILRVIYYSAEPFILVSFPGISRLQFLITCCMQKHAIKNWSRGRPGNEATSFSMFTHKGWGCIDNTHVQNGKQHSPMVLTR